MKIECFVANLTGSPQSGTLYFEVVLEGRFLVNSGHICGRRATLRCRNPLLSRSDFVQGHWMKIEWFNTNVTAVGCPDKAEPAILGVILFGLFWPIQAVFVAGEPHCDVGTPS